MTIIRFGPFMVSPIVAGLNKNADGSHTPVIATYDSIGCLDDSGGF